MTITQSEKEVVIFRNSKGYVMVRETHLAFGNKAKEIHYTKHIEHATQFPPHIGELQSKDFYHKFKEILDLEIKAMKCYKLKVTTTYEIVGE